MNHPIAVEVLNVNKIFTLHLRSSIKLSVVNNANFQVKSGQCSVLDGVSGSGKSSILKMVYGNYLANSGRICIQHKGSLVDIASASPRDIMDIRRHTIAYVSQFLRAVPRVSALDIVAEAAMVDRGGNESKQWLLDDAREKAADLLSRLNLPQSLWSLPPATFSGGEQQRVNIARGFIAHYPILLLDEPTASLDAKNRDVVIELIAEKKKQGTAILAICHDDPVRQAIADKLIDVAGFSALSDIESALA